MRTVSSVIGLFMGLALLGSAGHAADANWGQWQNPLKPEGAPATYRPDVD